EDAPIPAPQNLLLINPNFGGMPANWGTEVMKSLDYNRLYAMESGGGKVRWESGGKDEKHKDLVESIFLGPPLPLNGKLYVLAEQKQELRLIALDPDGDANTGRGKVVSVQSLATTKDLKLGHDPVRRIQACHLSHAEGILVIPTNAGAVFGVDLLT